MISRNSLGSIYPIKKLGNIADFLDSRRKPVKECDRVIGPYPYYGANGLQGWINDFLFDEDLILLAEDGGHFDNPDRGVAYKISGKTWVNNHAHVIKPKEGVDLDYLCRVLENYDLTPWITGTTRGKLTKGSASEILIPLPPLAEQRRIASILDQADELRQKRQQAIEKLDQLLQATFIDMFGDPVSNSKGFDVKKLSEQVDLIQIGPFGTQLHQEDYIENGIPLINPSHIKNGKIVPNLKLSVSQSKYGELSQYHLKLNDVLLGRRGEMGRCAVVTKKEVGWLCGTGSLFLRPNVEKINPFFLEMLLSSDSIKRYLENVSQGQGA